MREWNDKAVIRGPWTRMNEGYICVAIIPPIIPSACLRRVKVQIQFSKILGVPGHIKMTSIDRAKHLTSGRGMYSLEVIEVLNRALLVIWGRDLIRFCSIFLPYNISGSSASTGKWYGDQSMENEYRILYYTVFCLVLSVPSFCFLYLFPNEFSSFFFFRVYMLLLLFSVYFRIVFAWWPRSGWIF